MLISTQNFTAKAGVRPSDQKRIVTIAKRDAVQTKVAELDLEFCRDFLIGDDAATLTLNAVVRIARFVGSKIPAVNYSLPGNLSGTTADYPLIVTDALIAGIALLQAEAGRSVDGLPGPSFVRFVMGQYITVTDGTQRLLRFMDESPNRQRSDAQGTLAFPDLNDSEGVLYQYFRRMVLLRNGLWSEVPFVVNIVGVRRREGPAGQGKTWNDTLLACWTGVDDRGRLVPRARAFVGTTEPGNTLIDPTVPAQTYIVRLGYHHAQQPGGRGFRIMARDANNVALRFDRGDWRGINFHSGGKTGRPTGFAKGALPFGHAASETNVETHLSLTEAFALLSRWGLNDSKTSFEHLQDATRAVLPSITVNTTGSEIQLTQRVGNQLRTRNIVVDQCRLWLADFWVRRQNKKEVVFRILRYLDPQFSPLPQAFALDATGIAQLIQRSHILSIVRLQVATFGTIEQSDGLAGRLFLDIMANNITRISNAANDLQLFESLLARPSLTEGQRRYLRALRFNTAAERAALASGKIEDPLDFSAFEIDESIGTWSVACQVVFGCEQFYRFWRHVTRHARTTGQRQWYYTVLEYDSLV